MIDSYGRDITYLRLSVTELCNLRCRYCMPGDGICKKSHAEMLTEEEYIAVVKAAASLGISKVRITGGEPLVKKNIVSICEHIASVKGIEEICLTTNGILLPQYAKALRDAGVSRLNISLDTLIPDKYAYITRTGTLNDAFNGLYAALDAGYEKIKINTVLIGGFNDTEIEALANLTMQYPVDVRFIELMPMYDSGDFDENSLISCSKVLEVLSNLQPVSSADGVAQLSDVQVWMTVPEGETVTLRYRPAPGGGWRDIVYDGTGKPMCIALDNVLSYEGIYLRYGINAMLHRIHGLAGNLFMIPNTRNLLRMDDDDAYLQNGPLSWPWLQCEYLHYDVPAAKWSYDSDDTETATWNSDGTIKMVRRQEVGVLPMPMRDDEDKRAVKGGLKTANGEWAVGLVETITVNLGSRNAKLTVRYEIN